MASHPEQISKPSGALAVKAAAQQWQAMQRGRPPIALDDYLRSNLLLGKGQPVELIISDTHQYYWDLPCSKHLCFQTIQACIRQVIAHDGHLRDCLRCGSSYKWGAEPSKDRLASYWVQVAWTSMEWALEQPAVKHAMQTSTWHSGAALAGRDRGYVVEAKVLRGKFGAADMYVPGLDLIVQVDGEHHADVEQLKRDGRFNAAAAAQQRRVLRLWFADVAAFPTLIKHAVMQCLATPDAMVWHSSRHPAPAKQM
jgi:hypothetical protein